MYRTAAGIVALCFVCFTQLSAQTPEARPAMAAAEAQTIAPEQPVPLRGADSSVVPIPQSATNATEQKDALHPIADLPIPDSLRIPVLDFENADVREVLRGLGMQYNVNIFIDPEVTGAISLYLADISVKKAIDFIVRRSNYAYTVENGIIKVYKYTAPPPKTVVPPVVFRMKNGLLDVDIKDLAAADVGRLFSDTAGINVMVGPGIEKRITARLVAMKPEKALKAIAESNDLDCANTDGIFYLSKPTWGDGKSAEGGANQQLKRLSLTIKNGAVTLEVDNAALDQVVRSIALQSGINIVIYDRLTGEISAKLSDVPIDDALRFLLQNTKFTFWKEKSIYFVGSREMNQQKTTVIIPLKHIMADEAGISKILPPSISANAVVKYNSEHNSVIVIGSFDVVAQALEFIEKIDKPIPQVLIEALVVDFNVNKVRDYGLSIYTQGFKDTAKNWMSEQFLPNLNLKPGRKNTERILGSVLKSFGNDQIIQLPSNFRSAIQALETADIVKVHSTPQIATINGNPASITIGETRYYRLQKETTTPVQNNNAVIGTDERFEVIKFNTQLEVTPWVMDNGSVMVKIRPEFNIPRLGGDAKTPPNVDTRVIESMVRLRNGQTIVLGGQRQTENVVKRNGIPLLSGIPVLGWLFSSQYVSKSETQMMIFLTPHVYYGDDNAVSPDDYFGKEVNRMLDKYDIDRAVGKKRKTKAVAAAATGERDSAAASTGPTTKRKPGFFIGSGARIDTVKVPDAALQPAIADSVTTTRSDDSKPRWKLFRSKEGAR